MPADGSAVPESPASFADLGVPSALVGVLDHQGITAPFPVQAATLPDALAGRDILGRARTGSGKTLGFSLPMVSRLAGRPTDPRRPRGLVLVPTRELASQVTEVLRPLAQSMGLWVTTIYGGVTYGPQISALRRRTDIIVATPGRLADLIGQHECNLSDVAVTVIDEADQMADLGFLPIVRRLLESTPDGGQRMLFSATLDAAVDVLARRFLNNPALHAVDENSSPAQIEHYLLTVEPATRIAVIAALTSGEQRSLVFTRTKHGAERLARQLTQAGIPAAELHGNLRQGARTRNLEAFSSGLARVMVATDIAARGIHIDGIELVIHADPPTEEKAYVHRSGRTARAGSDGVVVTLQLKSQVKPVAAMMARAGITPHTAVAVDPSSALLTEIAGPPAPLVTVTGKVAELVQPEDRLARNDMAGKPQKGRPHRDGGRGQHSGQFPARREGAGGPRGRGDAGRSAGGSGRRPGGFQRDERPAYDARPPADRNRSGSDERPARTPRAGEDGRPARFERDDRAGRASYGDRNDRGPADRGERDSRYARDNRDDRSSGSSQGRYERSERSGGSGQGRSQGADRGSRPERGGYDWYPRAGGSSRGAFRPGGPARAGGPARPGGSFRADRPQGGDRPVRSERPGAGRTDRSPAGGQSGGSARRTGNSGARGAAGRPRGWGQG